MSLFNELKRRNVFRVGIAYVVAVWVIAQVADLVLDNFGAPKWVMQWLLVLLAVGFVVAIVIAWLYEFTQDGLKRETELECGDAGTLHAAKRLEVITIILGVAAVGLLLVDRLLVEDSDETSTARDAGLQAAAKHSAEANLNAGRSIAVLPFVNMSADSDNEFFSDGLSEELLNLLVKIPQLKVAARTSSFSYKDKDVSIARIGVELNVTHILEGSVRKAGDQVRIQAQLIKAVDGFQLWSETFDRTLDDVFEIQDEIAKAVVDGLRINLLGAMPGVRKTAPEVYSLYLQAVYLLNRQGEENVEKARVALQQALDIDPDYAPAWVSLAWTYGSQSGTRPTLAARQELRALEVAAIERALAIDENLAMGWASMAYQKEAYDSDLHGARIAVEKALQLEPNNSGVIAAAAWIATSSGRLSEAIDMYEKAISMDPLSLSNLLELGRCYLRVGRANDAFDMFGRMQAINPDHPSLNSFFSRVYMLQGDFENALLENEKNAGKFFYRHQKAVILHLMGREKEAQVIINDLLETLADDMPGPMAIVYAWIGDGDSAFEWLEKEYELGEYGPYIFLGSQYWRKLTGDPRYAAYVEKLGLLEEWQAMPPEFGGPPGSSGDNGLIPP